MRIPVSLLYNHICYTTSNGIQKYESSKFSFNSNIESVNFISGQETSAYKLYQWPILLKYIPSDTGEYYINVNYGTATLNQKYQLPKSLSISIEYQRDDTEEGIWAGDLGGYTGEISVGIGENFWTNIIVDGNTYKISDDNSKNNFFKKFPNLNNLNLSDCNLILHLIIREDFPSQNNDSLDTIHEDQDDKINLFNDLIYYWTNRRGYNVNTEIVSNKKSITKDYITISFYNLNYTGFASIHSIS